MCRGAGRRGSGARGGGRGWEARRRGAGVGVGGGVWVGDEGAAGARAREEGAGCEWRAGVVGEGQQAQRVEPSGGRGGVGRG